MKVTAIVEKTSGFVFGALRVLPLLKMAKNSRNDAAEPIAAKNQRKACQLDVGDFYFIFFFWNRHSLFVRTKNCTNMRCDTVRRVGTYINTYVPSVP